MKKTIEKYLWKLLRKADPAYHSAKTSWSQLGEDMIIDFIFTWQLGCPLPSYLDIGANHPSSLSNTYFFYKKGCVGVNVEPDKDLIKHILTERPKDINLNIGIGAVAGVIDFYRMSQSTLNTFSKTTAEEYSTNKQYGCPTVMSIEKVKVIPINKILEKYFISIENYFISIDVEGLDLEIVKSIDYERFKPKVICVETLVYTSSGMIQKQKEIIDYILAKGYFIYADTTVNTIFVKNNIL